MFRLLVAIWRFFWNSLRAWWTFSKLLSCILHRGDSGVASKFEWSFEIVHVYFLSFWSFSFALCPADGWIRGSYISVSYVLFVCLRFTYGGSSFPMGVRYSECVSSLVHVLIFTSHFLKYFPIGARETPNPPPTPLRGVNLHETPNLVHYWHIRK